MSGAAWAVAMLAADTRGFSAPKPEKPPVIQVTRESPLRITADLVIAEDRREGRVVNFTGHVAMFHQETMLTCQSLRSASNTLTGTEFVQSWGDVVWINPAKRVTLTCQEATYDELTEHLVARGHPRFVMVDDQGVPVLVRGEEMEVFSAKEVSVVRRQVSIEKREIRAMGEDLWYDYGNEIAVLKGNAVLYHENSEFQGREIKVLFGQQRASLTGSPAEAKVIPEVQPRPGVP